MKRIKTMVMLLVFAITFMVFQSSVAFAKSPDTGDDLRAINDCSGSASLSISNLGESRVGASVKADVGSSTEMRVYLQRKNTSTGSWMTIYSWKKSSKSATTLFETIYRLSVKGIYRCKMIGTVTRQGKTETVHATSRNVTY